jgi:hypothetical protein
MPTMYIGSCSIPDDPVIHQFFGYGVAETPEELMDELTSRAAEIHPGKVVSPGHVSPMAAQYVFPVGTIKMMIAGMESKPVLSRSWPPAGAHPSDAPDPPDLPGSHV